MFHVISHHEHKACTSVFINCKVATSQLLNCELENASCVMLLLSIIDSQLEVH